MSLLWHVSAFLGHLQAIYIKLTNCCVWLYLYPINIDTKRNRMQNTRIKILTNYKPDQVHPNLLPRKFFSFSFWGGVEPISLLLLLLLLLLLSSVMWHCMICEIVIKISKNHYSQRRWQLGVTVRDFISQVIVNFIISFARTWHFTFP
jgi:hypothetical protein